MSYVTPEGMRSTTKQEGGELIIEVPVKRNWFILIFLSFWLCGWLAGEIMVPLSFFSKVEAGPPMLFTIAWLGMWTCGGLLAILIWLWQVSGKEIIRFSSKGIIRRRALFSFGIDREFGCSHVRNLRVAPQVFNPFDFTTALQFWGLGGGVIAFDYGARTYRCGQGLDEAEAGMLVKKVKSQVNIPEA